MSTRIKVIVTVVAFALVGFLLNPNAPLGALVFGAPPASPPGAEPAGPQLGLLMLVGLIESVAFGLGAALLLHGAPLVRRLAAAGIPARAAWLAVAWGLVSWVPHTAMHMTNGANVARLLVIEYTFHVTLVLAAIVLARFLLQVARVRPAPRGEGAASFHPVGAG